MRTTKTRILTKQDIINTYDKRQQEQCRLYYKYKRIKQRNPAFGYKRIARLLGHSSGKTRWWHAKRHIPTPIQTADLLKEKGLIPLNIENPRALIIARILGASFGDGGIFANLNAVFLSSSELEAVKEFGEDLKKIFGDEIEENSRIIEGGEYGHSWCYQNTNRKAIRLFKALGAPIGRKSQMELKIPEWIFQKDEVADNFFGAFFGSELNVPKIHITKTRLDTLSIGFTGLPELEENRIKFFQDVKEYLSSRGIATGSICKSKNKGDENSIIHKIHISTKLDNVIKFKKRIKICYCYYKQEKLDNTITEFIELKKKRFNDLRLMGYNISGALNLLNINNEQAIQLLSLPRTSPKIIEQQTGEQLII